MTALRTGTKPLPADARVAHPSGAIVDCTVVALLEGTIAHYEKALQEDAQRLFALLYNQLIGPTRPNAGSTARRLVVRRIGASGV